MMKDSIECLKCGHETIWKIDPVSFFDAEYSETIHTLPVACRMVDNPSPGLLSRPTQRKTVGRFVAYVCAECGYTEWYAEDIEALGELMRGERGSKVRRLKKND